MSIRYKTIVRNYLAAQRLKPVPNTGLGKAIRQLLTLTEGRFGRTPSLVELTGALILAEYDVINAPNKPDYYIQAYG